MRTKAKVPWAHMDRLTAIAVITWVVATLGVSSTVAAQQRNLCVAGTPNAPSVYVDSSANDVVVVSTDGRRFDAARNLLLCPGDEIRTGATGRVAIRFDQKRTVIRLDGNSRTRILSGGTGSPDVSLLSGILYFVSSVRRQFQVDTPYIVAGIEGTEALIAVQPAQSLAMTTVREGVVSAYDHAVGPSRRVAVHAGEAAFRSASVPFQRAPIGSLRPPFRELLVASPSAVDWAIYYPPVLLVRDTRNQAVRDAIILLSSGDYDRAAARLDMAGSSEMAATAALRTIIAVSRNHRAEAEKWSKLALKANPNFAPAHIAASYVRQSVGDLDGAVKFAEAAAKLAPDNAYASARLAELYMTIGDRPTALKTAEHSLGIDRTPLALFVAGLARLAASQYERAEAYFREAIMLAPEAPLPRLGLGLTFIRKGKISAGAWEIERAVAHDPRHAALRTWLGRGYFEEGLTKKAANEFKLAKQEDPEDPTPYLFSALERYAANQPIPALRELQKAEEFGELRSVVRSERGLNEDTATRGAALGRIYDVLGFDQLAIEEGTRAVESDPSNPAAHRFLTDAYRTEPRYAIAGISELLQSQLLSPPSKTPIQPRLTVADLNLLEKTDPSRVTFAEFAPLYDADGLRFDATGFGGTQNTLGDEVAVTGLTRNFSLSVGQFHYETDGYRENDDLRHDIFDAVSTLALTPEFSIFGEYRNRDSEGGDRRLDFHIDDFNPALQFDIKQELARLGFHVQPTSNSDLIGVYKWADQSGETSRVNSTTTTEASSHSGQLQYIWEGHDLRDVTGASYIFYDESSTEITEPFPIANAFNTSFWNAYSYLSVDAPKRITWTIGGAIADYQEDRPGGADVAELLPKLGVRAKITDYLTLRASYLRNLKLTFLSEQVLEPTSVAGFNQLYDAFNGAVLDQVGGAIDLSLSESVKVGGEVIGRWWREPALNGLDGHTDEQVYRGYMDVTLSNELALAAEIIYEQSESDFNRVFQDWRTISIPITLSYFSESGVFGSVGVEFVDHRFNPLDDGGSDTFQLVNATLGYRFPDDRTIISVEGQNLFDERFNFQNQNRSLRSGVADPPRYVPELTILARATFNF